MAKTETTVIRVKGTRHYKAEDAFNEGKLNPGASIELRPEPYNRFDPNAVEVLLNHADKLGHISKDIAPKYQKLCFGGSILTATLESADKTSDYSIRGLDVRVKITYLSSTVDIDHELPASPGVYEISLGLGRAYVGSTGNLKNRVRQHFSQLNDLIHQNKPLQADFRRAGHEQFNFEVLKHCENASQALRLEEQEITRRHAAGMKLYNKTLDGRGRRPDNSDTTTTISDIQDPSSLPPRDTQPSVRKNIANKQAPESLQTSTPEDAPRTGYYSLTLADGSVFEGEFKDGKRHGFGRCIYPAGDLYEGNWSGDKRHGLGRMEWSFGNSYEGAWRENQITGIGRYEWKNGDAHEGLWRNAKREGPGTFFGAGKQPIYGVWEGDKLASQNGGRPVSEVSAQMREPIDDPLTYNGDGIKTIESKNGVHHGEIANNKRHGYGEFRYQNGSIYKGQWANGYREGDGFFANDNGYEYEGEWHLGEEHGKGKATFSNGATYEGRFIQGERSGFGVEKEPSGDMYVGTWLKDKKHGEGTATSACGDLYEGHWLQDKQTGRGTYTWATGGVYEGDFIDGKRTGKGRYTWTDGSFYEGDFIDGERSGHGEKTYVNGDVYKGAWQHDRITGTGRYSWKNGDSYEGSWLDGKRSGPGTFFELGKEPITTLWENDKSLGSQDDTKVHLKNSDSGSKGSQSHKQKAAQSGPSGNYAERLAVMAEAAEFVAKKLPEDDQIKQAAQASRATSDTFNKVVQGRRFVDDAIDGDLAGALVRAFGDEFTVVAMEKVGLDEEFLEGYNINQDDAAAGLIETQIELTKGADFGVAIAKGFGEYIMEGGALAPNNVETPKFIKRIGDVLGAVGNMYDDTILEPVKSAVKSESMIGPADAERVNLSNGDTYTGTMKDNKRHGVGKYEFVGGAVYEGDFVDGKRTGRGTYTSADGDVYEGDWLDGDRTGKGTYTFANGDVYEGDWLDGDRTGKGTYTSADGDVYEGVWLEGKRHGPGILKTVKGEEFKQTYRDGDLEKSSEVTSEAIGVEQKDGISDAVLTTSEGDYRGNVKDGVPHGLGIMEYANGDYYDGEWRDGVKSGEGCEFLEDGESYVGSFLDDARHGKGRCSDAGGDEYDGEWVKGELIEKLYNDSHSQDVTRLEAPDGRVSYKYANGDLYRGGWENGMPEGTGSMSYHNGDSYVGKWQAGQFHGTGVKKTADGDSFDGFWKQGKMHGRGVAQYSDGDTYEGQWANDLHDGKGIFTTADGQVYEGRWHEGEPE
jgi:hypothetical protein